jgi:hypothetical protein
VEVNALFAAAHGSKAGECTVSCGEERGRERGEVQRKLGVNKWLSVCKGSQKIFT